MKFTKEQFTNLGSFYIDDLNINESDQDFMFEVFNLLPKNLQGLAISHGFGDSVFGDNVFKYMIEKIHNISMEQYYDFKIYNFDKIDNETVLEKLK